MRNIVIDILRLYLLPLVLFSTARLVWSKPNSTRIIAAAWFMCIGVGVAFGAMRWTEQVTSTRLGLGLFDSASTWILGPFLVLSSGRRWRPVLSTVVLLLSPPVAYLASFHILWVLGQIWK